MRDNASSQKSHDGQWISAIPSLIATPMVTDGHILHRRECSLIANRIVFRSAIARQVDMELMNSVRKPKLEPCPTCRPFE